MKAENKTLIKKLKSYYEINMKKDKTSDEDWQKWYAHKSSKEIWIEEQEREDDEKLSTLESKNI